MLIPSECPRLLSTGLIKMRECGGRFEVYESLIRGALDSVAHRRYAALFSSCTMTPRWQRPCTDRRRKETAIATWRQKSVAVERHLMPKTRESEGKHCICRASDCAETEKSKSGFIWRKCFPQLSGKAKYLLAVCLFVARWICLPGFHFEAKVLSRDAKRGS